MVAILGYSKAQILSAVQDMYTRVADSPDQPFHFPLGRKLGQRLGYPDKELVQLPAAALDSFAGVGCPFHLNALRPGDVCLDIGAGAGVDSLMAARRVGEAGWVFALDLTAAMTRKLKDTLRTDGAGNISVIQGSAEALPLADASVDCITSNGALNLVPDKRRAIREMYRVLRPGGRVQLADVVIRRPVTVDCDDDPRLWVECVVGATVDEELLELLRETGFEEVNIDRRIDYFALSPSAQTREIASSFDAQSIELGMRRGQQPPGRLRQWLSRLNPVRLAAFVWRRGWLGMAGLGLAILTCYGLLAASGLLALMGVSLALNDTVWAGAIALFATLSLLSVLPGLRYHRSPWPGLFAGLGTGLVLYALFLDYRFLTELAGFVLLFIGVTLDFRRRRQRQNQVLGLSQRGF
ncbi:MerC family mercury resistance protein [Marinimicrobium sp. C2-29]|uniref:MerC family mercury resistance protein n=1 Tax=Marinimicrobium sp. C2-29 TaxID=3139825 RepID=UPI0031386710